MKKFLWIDKISGKTNNFTQIDLIKMKKDQDDNTKTLSQYAKLAKRGDEWNNENDKFICITE